MSELVSEPKFRHLCACPSGADGLGGGGESLLSIHLGLSPPLSSLFSGTWVPLVLGGRGLSITCCHLGHQ